MERWKTGINKGGERREEGSDEEINMNSSDWDDTDNSSGAECDLRMLHVQKP